MILSNHPNWVFISFVNGAFGHQLSRVLMTSKDAVWYDNPINGTVPWEWNHLPSFTGFGCSPNHLIKQFKNTKMVPFLDDFSDWADVGTYETFNEKWLTDILDSKRIVYPCHDHPKYLRERFPNSKIILIDVDQQDWKNCIKNQIEKTGSYAAVIPNTKTAQGERALWSKETGLSLFRDWQQHQNNLQTTEEWIKWTVEDMMSEMSIMKAQLEFVDSVLKSNDRNSIDSLVKVHNDIGLTPNVEDIQKVLNAFNLDALISNYLPS